MPMAQNDFGFEAAVSTVGYGWTTSKELGLLLDEGEAAGGPFMVERRRFGVPAQRLRSNLRSNRTLFREFASLDTADTQAMLAFADKYGPLGENESDEVCDWSESTRGKKQKEWLRGVRGMPIKKWSRIDSFTTTVEYQSYWIRNIATLRTAVAIRDSAEQNNETTLVNLLKWHGESETDPTQIGGWRLDTHPGLPLGKDHRERVFDFVSVPRRLLTPDAPIKEVALSYVAWSVTKNLRRRVRPVLELNETGSLQEGLLCETLLAFMWGQLFTAINEGREQKKCPSCGTWFDVGGRDGATSRKIFCSDKCRVRAAEVRKELVVKLAGLGHSPQQVLERLASEGHDTNLATVKKWIKSANTRKK